MLRAPDGSVEQRPQLLHLSGSEYLHRLAILAVLLELDPQRDQCIEQVVEIRQRYIGFTHECSPGEEKKPALRGRTLQTSTPPYKELDSRRRGARSLRQCVCARSKTFLTI